MEPFAETENDMKNELSIRFQEFMETEARFCSMDFGCVTPLYAYRIFGGQYSRDGIEGGLTEL